MLCDLRLITVPNKVKSSTSKWNGLHWLHSRCSARLNIPSLVLTNLMFLLVPFNFHTRKNIWIFSIAGHQIKSTQLPNFNHWESLHCALYGAIILASFEAIQFHVEKFFSERIKWFPVTVRVLKKNFQIFLLCELRHLPGVIQFKESYRGPQRCVR